MLLRRLALACAIFLIPALASAEPPAEVAKIQKEMLAPTVRLDDNCSGQIVYSKRDDKSGEVTTYILTAKHCVDDLKEGATIEVDVPVYDRDNRLIEERTFMADRKGMSYKADVALVQLRDRSTFFDTIARIAPSDVPVYQGEDTWVAGYPGGMDLTLTVGVLGPIARSSVTGTELEYYRSTPAVVGGNSGGGLYHKNAAGDYELIGVVTGVYTGMWHIGLHTPVRAVWEYLDVAAPEIGGKKKDEAKAGPR